MKRNILVGCTGSVATIKLPSLLKKLSQSNLEVQVVVTERAKHFLKDLELPTGTEIISDTVEWAAWQSRGDPVLHIDLAKWADVFLIAPLDANTLGKLASGICDNILTCVARAWDCKKPLYFCPAMNTNMWEHPLTSSQISLLKSWGHKEISCISKSLMCGDTGMGGMAEIDTIVQTVLSSLRGRDHEIRTSIENFQHSLQMGHNYESVDDLVFKRSLTPGLDRSSRRDAYENTLCDISQSTMCNRLRRKDTSGSRLLDRSLTPSLSRSHPDDNIMYAPSLGRSPSPDLERFRRKDVISDPIFADCFQTIKFDHLRDDRKISDITSTLDRSMTPSLERLRYGEFLDTPVNSETQRRTPLSYHRSFGGEKSFGGYQSTRESDHAALPAYSSSSRESAQQCTLDTLEIDRRRFRNTLVVDDHSKHISRSRDNLTGKGAMFDYSSDIKGNRSSSAHAVGSMSLEKKAKKPSGNIGVATSNVPW